MCIHQAAAAASASFATCVASLAILITPLPPPTSLPDTLSHAGDCTIIAASIIVGDGGRRREREEGSIVLTSIGMPSIHNGLVLDADMAFENLNLMAAGWIG